MKKYLGALAVLAAAMMVAVGCEGSFGGGVDVPVGNPDTNVNVETGDTNVSQNQDNSQNQDTNVDVDQSTDMGDNVSETDDDGDDDAVEATACEVVGDGEDDEAIENGCPEAYYCELPVGECTGVGVCVEIPEICTEEFMPVCGCDGETYGNDCNAAAAAVNIATKGECD